MQATTPPPPPIDKPRDAVKELQQSADKGTRAEAQLRGVLNEQI